MPAKKPVIPDPSLDTVPKLFHAQVEKYRDRVAMREKVLGVWKEISWNQYRQKVHFVAMALLKMGLRKGDAVSIISNNNPEWLYCDIATLCLGFVTVGIYTTSSSEEVGYIVHHSDSRILFMEDEEQVDKWLQARNEMSGLKKVVVYDMKGLRNFRDPMVMSFDDFLETGKTEAEKHPRLFDEMWPGIKPEDPAMIVYTSGTTGPPKGAVISHHNITWTNRALSIANETREGDEILSFLPLCHVAERNITTFSSMTCGWIINFSENLETVPENIREISPHAFFAVPRYWEKFYSSIILRMKESTWLEKIIFDRAVRIGRSVLEDRLAKRRLSLAKRIRHAVADRMVFRNTKNMLGLDRATYMISGGAPIAPDILQFFHAIGLPVREVYGQTEDTGPTAIHQGDDIKLGTVGKPIPGIEVKLAEDGEILVRGPNVFQGYYKDSALTEDILRNGWLHSGDLGEFDEEGNLIITDRKKDIIITSGGKNISPQYIENKLKFSPYINDAIIIGDKRKYLSSLIMIDKENVTQFAQENRIPFTTYKSLCQSGEIIDLIQKEVDAVNKTLARVESIKKFRLITIELTSEDEEMTATMKLKRKYATERFRDLIEEMY